MKEIIKLWKHQQDTFDVAKDQPEWGLFFEQGAGKTLTAITLWRYKCNTHQRRLRTLVVAPPITLMNWKSEFEKFSTVNKNHVNVLYGSQKKRVKELAANVSSGSCVFITNYEGLLMTDLFKAIQDWEPEVIIFDESHKLKDQKTKRAKASHKLALKSTYRWILTGTPILNSAMDIFSQFLALDNGATFKKNFFQFRMRYFQDMNAHIPRRAGVMIPPKWEPRKDTYEELNKLIYKKATRVLKQDCMDLPPLVKQVQLIEMSAEQARAYKQMEKSFITFLNDKACVAELVLTKGLRLQQIVSGYMTMDDGTMIEFDKNPRAKALKEQLELLTPNHKVLVWGVFKQNYKAIKKVCDDLEIEYAEVHGAIKDKFAEVDKFNNDPNCRVFIGHPLSAGIGINLVAASYSIFYSRNFSLEADLQAEARNYRGGSEIHKSITRIDLVAPSTVDEKIAEALANKQTISDSVLKGMVIK